MSYRVVPLVEDREFPEWDGISPSKAKWVMMKLAFCGNDDGHSVKPSIATVASDTQISERTVQRIVKKFLAEKLLVLEHGEDPASRLPRIYRIALDKLAELPLTAAAQGREVRRKDRERQARKRVAQRGDTVAPQAGAGGDTLAERGDTLAERGDTLSPDPSIDPERDPNARARDPAVESGGDASERDQEPTDPPANAHWKANQEALAAYFGDAYPAFIRDLVALADDGKRLRLGAPTSFLASHTQDKFGQSLGKLLAREVEVVQYNFDLEAHKRRQQAAEERIAAERATAEAVP